MSESKKPVRRKEVAAVETEPDAWERFERTMDKIAPPKRKPTGKDSATSKREDDC